MITPKVDRDGINVVIGTRHFLGPEWLHVDADSHPLVDAQGRRHKVDVVCDARKLDLPDKHADFVFTSECLEHFPWHDTEDVLAEWCRIVKVGGTIRTEVPDWLLACQQILGTDTLECDLAMRQIFFGGQINEYDFHYTGITHRMLIHWLEKLNFEVTNVERGNECGWLRVDGRRIS
jgi:predicted SAM-dependent methyltransferase